MRPVYAARFTTLPADRDEAGGAHDGVVALAHRWLVERAGRHGAEVTADAGQDYRLPDLPGAVAVEAEHLAAGDRQAWRAALEHPSPWTRGEALRTEIQAWPDAEGCRVTVRLLARAANGTAAGAARFDRPRLVPELLSAYAARAGTLPVSARAVRYEATGVERLVRDLTDPAREIPIVVVSARPDGTSAIDVPKTAGYLAGIARVVRLVDFDAAMALTREVGKTLSCFEGAVRIYWPGFSPDDDRYEHPLWIAAAIADGGMAGAMPRMLLRRIGAVAARRVEPDPAVLALARTVERARAQTVARQRRETATGDLEQLEQEELLRLAWAEIDQLNDRIAALERENQDLQELVARGFSSRAAFRDAREEGDPEEEGKAERDRIGELQTLADAVRLAGATLAGPHLELTESALKSAEKAPFRGPPQPAFAALSAIAAVADRYHSGRLDRPFAEEFKDLGQDFRANVSPTALGHYPNHYTFVSSKGKVEVGPHLALGRGNRRTSLRIYWHVDNAERRFVVCHVGEHLPDTTT
jgi:hypothetical protein